MDKEVAKVKCSKCGVEFTPYSAFETCSNCEDGTAWEFDDLSDDMYPVACTACGGSGTHDWTEKDMCEDCLRDFLSDDDNDND